MKIITNASQVDVGCAFVPTMGALHEGHASLFRLARSKSELVVASIFVNPLQFENAAELDDYPRTPDRDIDLAANSGVTHLWLPRIEEIYPENFVHLAAGPIGDIYEGAARAGHFDGVITVVARLFYLLKPKLAIFGEKDFQQLVLIRQLVKDLALEIEIIGAPIIREPDGVAMSSRNMRLDENARECAQVLFRALTTAARCSDLTTAQVALMEEATSQVGFNLDYAEIIDASDFSKASEETLDKRAIISGWLNGVRLIDNMEMKLGEVG